MFKKYYGPRRNFFSKSGPPTKEFSHHCSIQTAGCIPFQATSTVGFESIVIGFRFNRLATWVNSAESCSVELKSCSTAMHASWLSWVNTLQTCSYRSHVTSKFRMLTHNSAKMCTARQPCPFLRPVSDLCCQEITRLVLFRLQIWVLPGYIWFLVAYLRLREI